MSTQFCYTCHQYGTDFLPVGRSVWQHLVLLSWLQVTHFVSVLTLHLSLYLYHASAKILLISEQRFVSSTPTNMYRYCLHQRLLCANNCIQCLPHSAHRWEQDSHSLHSLPTSWNISPLLSRRLLWESLPWILQVNTHWSAVTLTHYVTQC